MVIIYTVILLFFLKRYFDLDLRLSRFLSPDSPGLEVSTFSSYSAIVVSVMHKTLILRMLYIQLQSPWYRLCLQKDCIWIWLRRKTVSTLRTVWSSSRMQPECQVVTVNIPRTNTFWYPPMQRYIGQQATKIWAGELQSITVKLRWRHLWLDKHPSYCCFSSFDNSSGEENKWLGRICSVWKLASLKQLRHAMLLWCLLFWVGVILIRNAWGELARKKPLWAASVTHCIAFCACCSTTVALLLKQYWAGIRVNAASQVLDSE